MKGLNYAAMTKPFLAVLLATAAILGAAIAEDNVPKMGLMEFTSCLRNYSKRTLPSGNPHLSGASASASNFSALRSSVLSDRDLARYPYVRNLVSAILSEIASVENAAATLQQEKARIYQDRSKPQKGNMADPAKTFTKTFKGEGEAMTAFNKRKLAAEKTIESNLANLEKYAITPAGLQFYMPIDNPFLAILSPSANSGFSNTKKRVVRRVTNMPFEVASNSNGLTVYERHMEGGAFVTDRSRTILVEGYSGQANPGDIIHLTAKGYGTSSKDATLIETYVVEEAGIAPVPPASIYATRIDRFIDHLRFMVRTAGPDAKTRERLDANATAVALDPELAASKPVSESVLKIIRETKRSISAQEQFRAAAKNPPGSDEFKRAGEALSASNRSTQSAIAEEFGKLTLFAATPEGKAFQLSQGSPFLRALLNLPPPPTGSPQ